MDKSVQLSFLGTGTSQGVPVIACHCEVCKSTDEHDKRLRTSAMLEVDGRFILIDAGPDFRQQLLREDLQRLDAILLTHEHKDHTAGIDDVRAFNHVMGVPIDIYAEERVCGSVINDFAYAFKDEKYPGVPDIKLHPVTDKPFMVAGLEVQTIRLMHLHLPIFGFRIGRFAYLTDANYIPEESWPLLEGVEVLVINALRKEKHLSHFNLSEALEAADRINAKQTYLTHLSHQMGFHKDVQAELPPNVFLAYDGLKVSLNGVV